MRFCTLSLLFTLSGAAMAQVPMERLFTLPGALNLAGATRDQEGHYILVSEYEQDIHVTRISPEGEHEWTRAYPLFTEEGLYGNSVAVGDDGILVAGYTMGFGTNARDGLLLHIGLDGTLNSAERVDAGANSNAFHHLKAIDNGFIATGRADQGMGDQYDMLLTKLDASGTIEWTKTYGSSGWDWGYEAIQLADGGFAMVGYGDGLGTGFSPSGYVVRTDADGNELWARSISSGAGVDETYCILENAAGDLYIGGRSLGYISGDVTAFLTKLNSSGQHIWTRILQQGIEVVALTPADNGGVNFLAHPQYLPQGGGDYDMHWGTFSADGTLLRSQLHGGSASDNGYALFNMPGGALSIIGFTRSADNEWVGKLIITDTDGHADCGDLDLELTWSTATANVAAFSSLTGDGATSFPLVLGNDAVDVATLDPCCAVVPDFTLTSSVDPYSWTFTNTTTGATSYSWDFGDGGTSTETSPTHVYAGNGDYTVCLTATASCGEASICRNLDISVGMPEEAARQAGISLFPSPAADRITVQAPTAIATLQLIDAGGRITTMLPGAGASRLTLDVQQLPAGLYAVRVLLTNGALHHIRAVVAH